MGGPGVGVFVGGGAGVGGVGGDVNVGGGVMVGTVGVGGDVHSAKPSAGFVAGQPQQSRDAHSPLVVHESSKRGPQPLKQNKSGPFTTLTLDVPPGVVPGSTYCT